MMSLVPVVLGVTPRSSGTLPLRPQAVSLGFGQPELAGVVTQYLAVAVVVSAALLIVRLHRKVMAKCREL